MNNKETIKYHSFTKHWGNNAWCKDFAGRVDIWLNQFQDDDKPMMLSLLKHFLYFSEYQISNSVVTLYDEFVKQYNVADERLFTCVQKEYGVGFSDIAYTCFWSKNNLYDCAEKNIVGLVETNDIPKHIIFFDDYSGSGDTFTKFIKKLILINPDLKTHELYFLTICISETAIKCINEFAQLHNLSIKILSLTTQDKAFSDNRIFGNKASFDKLNKYIRACDDLHIEKYVLGYKEIEALVSFEYNTPNNTLAAFWHEMDDFVALFKRKNIRSPRLNELRDNSQKKHALYGGPPVIFSAEDYQTNLFMVYCLCLGRQFSISKAIVDFGMTTEQIDEKLNLMFSLGYLKYENSKPIATAKLNKYLFHSRLKDFKKVYDELREENKVPEYDFDNDTYIPKDFAKSFKGYK